MKILVTVIIPVYNTENFIISCLESVLNQTYKNFEVIVIDDGSTDSTLAVLNDYQCRYKIPNLRIVHQINSGPSAARNIGIQLAKGEYIAFLDSDDIWKSNKLEKQIKAFNKNPDTVIIGTLSGTKMIQSEPYLRISLVKLLFFNYFVTSTVMCRTDIFIDLRFNEKQKYSEDYRLWLEILANYGDGIILNENLVIGAEKKRYGDCGLSAALSKMEKGEITNYIFLYRNRKITFLYLTCTIVWSLLKYCRRLFMTYVVYH